MHENTKEQITHSAALLAAGAIRLAHIGGMSRSKALDEIRKEAYRILMIVSAEKIPTPKGPRLNFLPWRKVGTPNEEPQKHASAHTDGTQTPEKPEAQRG